MSKTPALKELPNVQASFTNTKNMKLPPIKPLIDTDARTNPHAKQAQDLMYGKAPSSTQYTVEETLSFMKNGALTYKDIFSVPNSVILHICNTAGGFDKGFAGEVAKKYPGIKEFYKLQHRLNELKMGDIHKFRILGESVAEPQNRRLPCIQDARYVINLYAMEDYAKGKQSESKLYLNYEALEGCLDMVWAEIFHTHVPVIPYGMGAGNAGGDWRKVIEIMDAVFDFYLVCKLP